MTPTRAIVFTCIVILAVVTNGILCVWVLRTYPIEGKVKHGEDWYKINREHKPMYPHRPNGGDS